MGGCEIPLTDPSAVPLASNAPTLTTTPGDRAAIRRPGSRWCPARVLWQQLRRCPGWRRHAWVHTAAAYQLRLRQALAGLAGAVLVAASPGGPADGPASSGFTCQSRSPGTGPPAGQIPAFGYSPSVTRMIVLKRPCQAVRPEMGTAAATVWPMPAGSGARLRASTAVYSASDPSRVQSASPNTLAHTQAGGAV